MDRYLQYIADQKRKERKQIERSTAALAELDRMERHYIKSGAAGLAIHTETTAQLAPVELHAVGITTGSPVLGTPTVRIGGTLKERVLSLLDQHPDGLVSQQILKGLQEMGYPELKRTSVSPQLSRLRDDGTLENVDGVWRRSKNTEATPSSEGVAS